MATREIDIGQMITATEKEIAGSAWGQEDEIVLDETGDRSQEAMGDGLEGQHEPDDDDEASDADQAEGEEESESGEEIEAKGEESDKDKPEGDDEGKAAGEGKDGKEQSAQSDADADGKGRVPSARLREQTEKTRAAETERDTLQATLDTERENSRKAIDALNARLDGVLAAMQRQQAPQGQQNGQQQAQPAAPPDLFEDPKGFVDHLNKGWDQRVATLADQMERQRVNSSLELANYRHGETFTKAMEAMGKLDPRNPDDLALGRRLMASPNPGEAIVQWHQRNETLREVGSDPAAYKKRIADETRTALMQDPEFRKQLLASLKADAETGGPDGKPRTQVRLPRSLNGATGGNSAREVDPTLYDDSDRSVADSAWR